MASRISSPLSNNLPLIRPKSDATNKASEEVFDRKRYAPPHRAQFNYIPSPDALRSMIERALEALSKGVYWDRGSIVNLLL